MLKVVGDEASIGILSTDATLAPGLYLNRNRSRRKYPGISWVQPTAVEMLECVMPGIAAVKAGRLTKGRKLLQLAAQALRKRGRR